MVGKCNCGKRKFNMHNQSLTEIPWMCDNCRELSVSVRRLAERTCNQPKKIRLISLVNDKRREYV